MDEEDGRPGALAIQAGQPDALTDAPATSLPPPLSVGLNAFGVSPQELVFTQSNCRSSRCENATPSPLINAVTRRARKSAVDRRFPLQNARRPSF